MEEKPKLRIDPLKAVLVCLQLAFTVFAVISFKQILEKKSVMARMAVENYGEIQRTAVDTEKLDSLDDMQKAALEGALYDIIALNSPSGTNIPNSGAKIREGSMINRYLPEFDAYFLNFLVDIEELGQSYRVVYRWAEEYPNDIVPIDDPLVAFCPRKEELIYGDFGCQDEFNGNGEDRMAYEMIKKKTFYGFTVGLLSNIYNGARLELGIYAIKSDQEEEKVRAVETVREYLQQLGFNLDNFEYTTEVWCCSLD